jgi:hypothetical protein
MYDSVDAQAIPTTAQMVAGYIDGTSFRWPESAWGRFPDAVKVRIARRTSTNDGHVLDVESGIPTVWPINEGIVQWVVRRRQAGVEPTIYCNQLNDWNPIRTLFRTKKVREPSYWVARYDNKKTIPAGAVAKQYANPPLAGGHYDLSIVADYWPGVDPMPTKPGDGMADLYSVLDTRVGKDANDALRERYKSKPGTLGHLILNTSDDVNAIRSIVETILQESRSE